MNIPEKILSALTDVQRRMAIRLMALLFCAAVALGLFTAAAHAEGGIATWEDLQAAVLTDGGEVQIASGISQVGYVERNWSGIGVVSAENRQAECDPLPIR